jgi:N-carbamoyl-L-amino-acid hydrolase
VCLLRDAMQQAGLDIEAIPKLQRNPADYLGFVEVHIEQGPVLNEIDLPLGIVTSINGGVRYLCEVTRHGQPRRHHADGPPARRRGGSAELALFVEQRAAKDGDSVGTIGMLNVPSGSINVVPGRCQFSLDLRAPTDPQRDALVADVLAQLKAICERRGVRSHRGEPCAPPPRPAPGLAAALGAAVDALACRCYRMPSGAGHDAMKLHE